MRIAFWNTNQNRINSYIANLVACYSIDCMILAEYTDDPNDLQNRFVDMELPLRDLELGLLGSQRVQIFGEQEKFSYGTQDKYYSLHYVNYDFILCAVHLRSDMHYNATNERRIEVHKIKRSINEISKRRNNKRIVIVGDLNENPWDPVVVSADGFHGIASRNETERITRTVDRQSYDLFYNPMWNLLGDTEGPPGTFFLNESKLDNPLWHTLDQVIISPAMIKDFPITELKVITTIGEISLRTRSGRPSKTVSDHFPIVFEVRGVH